MFTGLIEKTGRFVRLAPRGAGYILTIEHEQWKEPLSKGESISISGTCLTLTNTNGTLSHFDVLAETADVTSLKGKNPGALLNLERALRVGDRLGGHVVTGHIDGTGIIRKIERAGEDRILAIRCSEAIMELIIKKGSVAVDGISLTVSDVTSETFSVHIIPTTWDVTSLASLNISDNVNIETDILGKYVKKLCARPKDEPAGFNAALF